MKRDQKTLSLRKPQFSPGPNLKRTKQKRIWITINPVFKKMMHSLNSVDIEMWYGVGSTVLGRHQCYESWSLKCSVSMPPSWEKPRSIASSPHLLLVTLVLIGACGQFATHRVLSVQVSTTPVVCQPRQAVTLPFRTSILPVMVQRSTRTSPRTDIWLSFFFSYASSE